MDVLIKAPSLPVLTNKPIVFYSVFSIIWWLAIWGLAETIMMYLVKNSLIHRAGIYINIIFFMVLLMIFYPQITEHL